ncbi:MAG TPA: hypothetical protein DCR04_01255 [Flavobacteriales bacterium]|nr:hypothetical protein [Flavobacteriales bacterium]HAP68349.1 hypothetical protein [Flavobacteriales bacterium]
MEKATKRFTGLIVAGVVSFSSSGQGVSISNTNSAPDATAILDLDVSGFAIKKGMLLPRMTEGQKLEIVSPASSLMVYQTDETEGFYYYDGSQWKGLGDDLGTHKASRNLEMSGSWISSDGDNEGLMIKGDGKVGIGVSNPDAAFHTAGTVEMDDLEGTGTRMVVADADGQLATQAIPSGGPGAGTTLYLNVTTGNTPNLDVDGVSFIHVTSDDDDNEIRGFKNGVLNQIIYLINTSDKDLKFKKNVGNQKFLKDFDLKKEEGGLLMYSGSEWHVISKH